VALAGLSCRGELRRPTFRRGVSEGPGGLRLGVLPTGQSSAYLSSPRAGEPLFKLRTILNEVGRRRVARVAIIYAAIAFALLEATDIVIPALEWPEWIIRWVIALAVLGFPLVLILAWVYDVTPEGVVRTAPLGEVEREEQGGTRAPRPVVSAFLLLASGALLAAGALFTFQWSHGEPGSVWGGDTPESEELDPQRIAVLPFTALDQTDEGGFFANGIHEDILNHLAKIGSLQVISRTTVLQYRESGKSAREIGRELNAGSILEGTVRRVDDRIRVVTQLIDARTDNHIWSETYDREEGDVFQVQSEIAQEIARALRAELSLEEMERLGTAPRVSGEAYDRYAQGLGAWDLREDRVHAVQAAELFQEATELEPGFARAWAALSGARMWLFWNFPGFQEQAELAREALDRALALDPDAVETRLALGYFHFYGRGDPQEALRFFGEAEALKPSDANVMNAIGLVLRGQGRWEEALGAFERARTFDPRSFNLNFTLAETYLRMRRFQEAERYLRLAATLAPETPSTYRELLKVRMAVRGDTVAGREYLESLPPTLPDRVRESLEAELAYYRGDFSRARLGGDPQGTGARRHERLALIYHLMGREDLRDFHADSLHLASFAVLEAARANPGPVQAGVMARAHAKLGIAYALLGEEINAWVEGSSAVSLVPLSTDAYEGADHMRDLAVVYTLIGEFDLAVQQLETTLSVPSPLNRLDLLLDPVFEPLRSQSGFEALLASSS
jgi:TolB-like protein/Tfp pilus assembly protein PilF